MAHVFPEINCLWKVMGYIKFVRKRTCKVSKSGPQTKGFALSLPSMLFVHIINVFWKNVKTVAAQGCVHCAMLQLKQLQRLS